MAAMPEPSSRLRSSIRPFELACRHAVEDEAEEGDAADFAPRAGAARARTGDELAAKLGELALEAAPVLDEIGDAGADLFLAHLEAVRDVAERLALGVEMGASGVAGERLDAANARGDPALRGDGEKPDLAGAPDMRAAAKLDRERLVRALPVFAHRDDAHHVAIFLAEQGARAARERLVERHHADLDGRVLQDRGVRRVLDAAQLVVRQRARLREVETQPVRRDERALLRHMLAEHAAQRLMGEMGRGVIGLDR